MVPETVVCKFSGSTLSILLKHAKKVYYAESVFVLIILIDCNFVCSSAQCKCVLAML